MYSLNKKTLEKNISKSQFNNFYLTNYWSL